MKHLIGILALLGASILAWAMLRSRGDGPETDPPNQLAQLQQEEEEEQQEEAPSLKSDLEAKAPPPKDPPIPQGSAPPEANEKAGDGEAKAAPSPGQAPPITPGNGVPEAGSANVEKPEPQVPAPWEADIAKEPISQSEFRFEALGDERLPFDQATLKGWLEPAGPGGEISQSANRPATIKGLLRLKAPWPDDGAVRLNMQTQSNGIRIHVFHGEQGVLLVRTLAPRERWFAYLTERDNPNAMPDRRYLTADDGNRAFQLRRQHEGPLEIHWRDGLLRLVSGATTLLAAPLAGKPTEVYLEGDATLYGIELRRCETVPALPPPLTANSQPWSAASWDQQNLAENARLEVAKNLSIELIAEKTVQPGWVTTQLPAGFFAVDLEVEGSVGAGLFIANADGQPKEMVRWANNAQDENRFSLFRTEDRAVNKRNLGKWPTVPTASVPQRHWVRLLAGPRTLRWWISCDGKNWSAPEHPAARHLLHPARLGLFHAAGISTRLTIHQTRLAPLASLNELSQRLTARLPYGLADASQPAPPCESVDDVAAEAWRRIHSGSPRADDYRRLYDATWNESVSQRRQLLLEISQLLAVEGNTGDHQWLVEEAVALAAEAWERDGVAPYTWCQRTILALELSTSHFPHDDFEPLAQLKRREVLGLAALQRWSELRSTCEERVFYEDRTTTLMDWALSAAARHSDDGRQGGPRTARLSANAGTALWSDQIDKPTYNLMTEFEGLLDAEAWETAAGLAARGAGLQGLAPHPRDHQLLTTFAIRLNDACVRHPAFRRAMAQYAQPIAQLYANRVLRSGVPEAVEHVAMKFPATPAAAAAWVWLGDLALSEGRDRTATAYYREAIAQDPYTASAESKLQLALAMSGSDREQTLVDSTKWSETTLDAAATRKLVDSLRPAATPNAPTDADWGRLETSAKLTGRGKIEEPFGRDPRQQVARYVNERDVDWWSRQLGMVATAQDLILCNRFQIAAFDADGQRLWQTQAPADPKLSPQRARDLSLTPSRPVVIQNLVAARLLYGTGGIIQCVSRADGATQWARQLPSEERWASDPVAHDGKLWAVIIGATADVGDLQVSLVSLRAEDGELLSRSPLGQLRPEWMNDQHCQMTSSAHGLVISLGDVALLAKSGIVHWLRRRPCPPSEQDIRRPLEWIEPPRITPDGSTVILNYPGLPLIQALSVATGAVQWEQITPAPASIPEVNAERLLVWTDGGLECRRSDNGELLWQRPWERRCRSLIDLGDHFACLLESVPQIPVVSSSIPIRSFPTAGNEKKFVIERRRWRDGEVVTRTALDLPAGPKPRLGPLILLQGRWATLHGSDNLDATRTIMMLEPVESEP